MFQCRLTCLPADCLIVKKNHFKNQAYCVCSLQQGLYSGDITSLWLPIPLYKKKMYTVIPRYKYKYTFNSVISFLGTWSQHLNTFLRNWLLLRRKYKNYNDRCISLWFLLLTFENNSFVFFKRDSTLYLTLK